MNPTPTRKQPTFGEAFGELEKITEDLESDTLDLDKAIEKFERGLLLAQQLKSRLQSVEQRVEKIRRKFDTFEVEEQEETEAEKEDDRE